MKNLIIAGALLMSFAAHADNKVVLECSYKYASLQVSEGPSGELYFETSTFDRKGNLYADQKTGNMILKGTGTTENTVIMNDAKITSKSDAGIQIQVSDSLKSVVTLAVGKPGDSYEVRIGSNNKELKKMLLAGLELDSDSETYFACTVTK